MELLNRVIYHKRSGRWHFDEQDSEWSLQFNRGDDTQ